MGETPLEMSCGGSWTGERKLEILLCVVPCNGETTLEMSCGWEKKRGGDTGCMDVIEGFPKEDMVGTLLVELGNEETVGMEVVELCPKEDIVGTELVELWKEEWVGVPPVQL
jgi:hypothetical protein